MGQTEKGKAYRKTTALTLVAIMAMAGGNAWNGKARANEVASSPVVRAAEALGALYPETLDVRKIASYDTGYRDEKGGVAEIVKFNAANGKAYVINGKTQAIEVVDLGVVKGDEEQTLTKEASLDLPSVFAGSDFVYGDVTSIDVNAKTGVVVAAVQERDYRKNGRVVVLDETLHVLDVFETGVQPDMVKMSDDGKRILTANEGEPRAGKVTGEWDPPGSVTVIDYRNKKTRTVTFADDSKIDDDVRIRNKTGGALTDLEPEYIALSSDEKTAYVTLQENNAVATIDVNKAELVSVRSLGFKDHSVRGNELDAGRDGVINIENLPLKSLYMPDGISAMTVDGVDYVVTANEGDATEWGKNEAAFTDVSTFKSLFTGRALDATDSTFGAMTAAEANAKLETMKTMGNYDKLEVLTDVGTDAVYIVGGRSFSIWKADTMELVYDSGADFERIVAEQIPLAFNLSNDDNEMDKRSAKKGPEPEDVKIGRVGDRLYAFIGLERVGGVMTYDVTNPSKPTFADYTNTRLFTDKIAGDVSPEGLDVIAASDSPTTRPLVLVGNEISGTVSVLQLDVVEDGKKSHK